MGQDADSRLVGRHRDDGLACVEQSFGGRSECRAAMSVEGDPDMPGTPRRQFQQAERRRADDEMLAADVGGQAPGHPADQAAVLADHHDGGQPHGGLPSRPNGRHGSTAWRRGGRALRAQIRQSVGPEARRGHRYRGPATVRKPAAAHACSRHRQACFGSA
jgi:hypothetical protein